MKQVIFMSILLLGMSVAVPVERTRQRTPTLMISLDGFQANMLDRFLRDNPDSYMNRFFVDRGVKADYLRPSFPTLTFPNHFTLVTGLYQESHGIVGNTVFDPDINKRMNFLSDNDANNEIWWDQAEPIWLTAKKQVYFTLLCFTYVCIFSDQYCILNYRVSKLARSFGPEARCGTVIRTYFSSTRPR